VQRLYGASGSAEKELPALDSIIEYFNVLHILSNDLKKALHPKGILLGILLLIMAIASTVVIYQLRYNRMDAAAQTETP